MLNTNDNDIDKVDVPSKEADSVKKLQDWVNAPTVSDLKLDLTEAQSDHSVQVAKIEKWLDHYHIRNSAKVTTKKGRSEVQPQLIRKQAEWRYASLAEPFLSNEDLFSIEARTFEDKERAEQNAIILNYQFNCLLNKVSLINEYIRTSVDEGTCIVKVGWEYETREITTEEPIFNYMPSQDPAVTEQLEFIAQMQQEDPYGFKRKLAPEVLVAFELSQQQGTPMWFTPTDEVEEVTNTVVVKNQPTVEICNIRNVIPDPTCQGNLSRANFIIYSFETSKAELAKSGLYKNLDKIQVQNASVLSAPDSHSTETTSFNFKDEPRKKILAYEYWGKWDIHGDGTTVPIVATFVGDTMIRLEENPFPDGFLPFVAVPYLPVRKSIYGEPDGALIIDNQKIIGAVTRGMIDIMARSANGQIGYRKDALDVTNRSKLLAGDDFEINPQVNPEQAFYMHKYPEIPQSAQFMLQLQNSDADSLTGVKSFGGTGISGQALGNTATGVRSALDATAKRDLDILRRLAAGLEEIGRKIIAMNALFLSEEETVRITNGDFVRIQRDDLKGSFDLRLTISTAEVDNQKAEELAYMLQTMGNNLDFGITQMILADIAKLRKMPTLAKKIENYKPQPDPIAEEIRMLEVEKLKAEIAKLHAEAGKKEAEASITPYKAQTEVAKQRHLNSVADKTDLDFVEQETGTTQERDLQKHVAQAEANKELKVLEAMLNPKTPKQ